MVFASSIFLFAFLPLFLLAYYATPQRWRSLTILIGSYVFYGWWRVDYLLLVAGISLWSYAAGWMIEYSGRRKLALILGLAGNLSTLLYFKYFGFLLESLNSLGESFGQVQLPTWQIILPIGISFHVFQAVSYLIDVYRRDTPPCRSLIDFLAFGALFPQLIAGPVLRYKDIASQFAQRTHSWDSFNEGCRRFAIGFASKVLVADTIAPLVNLTFTQSNPSFMESWLGALAFTAQLYFDFSGYSHMAIGLGLMMGFRFMENFNQPYLSYSISQFWQRWHISLSTWLRDYLYIPLGGNRGTIAQTLRNILLTMAIGGFWHGANWTFLLWGLWHGAWMSLERLFGGAERRLFPIWLALPATFLVVVWGWVIFRAPDIATATSFYRGMLGLQGLAVSDTLLWQLQRLPLFMLAISYTLIFAPRLWQQLAQRLPGWLLAAFLLAVLRLIAESYSPFLYFQF